MNEYTQVDIDTLKVRADILKTIKETDRQVIAYRQIAEMCLTETSKTSVGRWVKQAEERGLLQATIEQGNTTIFHKVTETGEQFIQDYHPYLNDWEGDDNRSVQFRLHHSELITEVQDFENLPKEWKRKVAESRKWNFQNYDPDNRSIQYLKDIKGKPGYLVTIEGEKIMFRLMEDIKGYEADSVMIENWEKAKEAINIIEEDLGLVIRRKPELVFRANTRHLSIMKDPFAQFVKESSDIALQDIEIRDDEDELRLKLDCSEHPEMEAGWGNKLSTKKYHTVADILFVKNNLYEFIITHKKKWNAFLKALSKAEVEDILNMFE